MDVSWGTLVIDIKPIVFTMAHSKRKRVGMQVAMRRVPEIIYIGLVIESLSAEPKDSVRTLVRFENGGRERKKNHFYLIREKM